MTTQKEFRESLENDGFAISEVTHAAGKFNDKHAHEFTARVMCLEGSITIATDDGSTTCGPGDFIEMKAGREHTERVGENGARLLVGRLHP